MRRVCFFLVLCLFLCVCGKASADIGQLAEKIRFDFLQNSSAADKAAVEQLLKSGSMKRLISIVQEKSKCSSTSCVGPNRHTHFTADHFKIQQIAKKWAEDRWPEGDRRIAVPQRRAELGENWWHVYAYLMQVVQRPPSGYAEHMKQIVILYVNTETGELKVGKIIER